MSVQILHLSFEHYRDSVGIAERKPRISWRFSGDAQNWVQKSYELGISRGGETEETYKISSSDSVLVPWPGNPLSSGERATVRVRAFGDEESVSTAWSSPAVVEAGLLRPEDWKCALIESSIPATADSPIQPILFRRTFNVARKIKAARFYGTAHGVYEAEINGKRVGDHVLSPGWTSYQHRLHYQTFDVTELLQDGQNAIGAHVGEGWYAGRLGFMSKRNIYGSRLGFVCQLKIIYDDGETEYVVSDSHWRSSTGAIISSEIYDGETYDARLEQPGWSSPGFDDGKWAAVIPTGLKSITDILVPIEAAPVRRMQEVTAQKIIKSPSGKVIVDFGQNLVGWLRIHVKGPAGHKITFTHTEVLENGECATRPLRNAAAKDTIILSGDEILYEPKFTFHGFQYVEIVGWPSDDQMPKLEDLTAVVVHSDMERTGWLECSEPLLNKLHENIIWGMKGNFLSIPTDCPQRDERLGWTGDIHVFASTATFLFDSTGMLQDWLRNLACEQLADGGTVPPLVSPNVLGPMGRLPHAIWGDAVISTPWDLFKASGDNKILSEQYESMKRWIDEGIPRNKDGLWDGDKCHQLGDWLDPMAPPDDPGNGRTDGNLVADAFLYGMTNFMLKISELLGEKEDEVRYQEASTRIKKLFNNEYITANGRVISDSQTSIALAIYFGLFTTPAQQLVAAERLEFLIRSKSRFKVATGFAGTPIIGHALTMTGMTQLFYRMLLHRKNPSWLYPVMMGATTVWERWDSMLPDGSINPGEMTSFNHYALGSVAHWMHKVMGGLSSLEPGWRKILVKPIPGGSITRTKTSYLSPYGLACVEWEVKDEVFKMNVTIPPNTTAEVFLPGSDTCQTVGSGQHSFEQQFKMPEWPPLPIYPPFFPHDDDEV